MSMGDDDNLKISMGIALKLTSSLDSPNNAAPRIQANMGIPINASNIKKMTSASIIVIFYLIILLSLTVY